MNQILYIQNKLNNKTLIIGLAILLVFCIVLLSTIFSIINIGNTNILSGVKVCQVDLSNLSKEEAKIKLELELSRVFTQNMEIVVNNVPYIISSDNLSFSPDYDKMIEEAYKIGRKSNFLVNNFSIQKAYIFGYNIEFIPVINEDIFNEVLTLLKQNITETAQDDTYVIENDKIVITRGKDGIALNIEKLKQDIIKNFTNFVFKSITVDISNSASRKIDLNYLYEQVSTPPIDATTVTENGIMILKEHIDGKTFDLANAKSILETSNEPIITIPLIITPASITKDQLLNNLFGDLLATYSTNYKESEKNRSINVKLAASKINGVILYSGDEFSFNNIVGERSAANGFKIATIYANNKLEQGLGGGICQVSSTLYNSVLLANLEVIARKNHQLTVSYVPLGRDATVVYGGIDFNFKNNRSTPIKLETTAENGILTINVYGQKSDSDVEVEIKTVTNRTIPFSTTTQIDNSLPEGQKMTVQNGHNGYVISTYVIKKRNGEEISNELITKSTYNPMNAIVKVGPTSTTDPTQPSTSSNPSNPSLPPSVDIPDPTLPPGWDVPENPKR